MSEEGIVASGGWCAPSEAVYDLSDAISEVRVSTNFPRVSVKRGGFKFPQPGSPEWERARKENAAQEAVTAMIRRMVGDVMEAQRDAIETACWDALELGMTVHVYDPEPDEWHSAWERYGRRGIYRFIGIELTPGPVQVHYHHYTRSIDW